MFGLGFPLRERLPIDAPGKKGFNSDYAEEKGGVGYWGNLSCVQ